MRHIVLSDDGYNISDDAYHRLLAISYFPESPRDQEQGLFIAAMEQNEFDRVGHQHYCPSEITQAAFNSLQRRTAQLYTVGFVAISMTWLKSCDQTPSLTRASIITSCAANEFGKILWVSALGPTEQEKLTAVSSDPSTIAQVFRKYRSVSHIWAAHVASGEYLEPLHVWDRTPEVIGSVIRTSATFQNAIEGSIDTSEWNLWDVTRYFPKSLEDWPVLYPQDELRSWIEIGYQKAIEQGLIKR